MKPIWVIDASVILKWLLPAENEEYVPEALSIRDALVTGEIEVLLPALWRFEVGNTLCRLRPEVATDQLQLCADLGLQEVNHTRWQSVAIRLATQYPVTFYDASYHAVALTSQARLITADERYVNRVTSEGSVIHLKHWPLS